MAANNIKPCAMTSFGKREETNKQPTREENNYVIHPENATSIDIKPYSVTSFDESGKAIILPYGDKQDESSSHEEPVSANENEDGAGDLSKRGMKSKSTKLLPEKQNIRTNSSSTSIYMMYLSLFLMIVLFVAYAYVIIEQEKKMTELLNKKIDQAVYDLTVKLDQESKQRKNQSLERKNENSRIQEDIQEAAERQTQIDQAVYDLTLKLNDESQQRKNQSLERKNEISRKALELKYEIDREAQKRREGDIQEAQEREDGDIKEAHERQMQIDQERDERNKQSLNISYEISRESLKRKDEISKETLERERGDIQEAAERQKQISQAKNEIINQFNVLNGKVDAAQNTANNAISKISNLTLYSQLELNTIIQNSGWFKASDNRYYRFFSRLVNYDDAESLCEKMGATLAAHGIRRNRSEIIDNIVAPVDAATVWIGLDDDIASKGNWMWIDGVKSITSNTDWYPGRPNNTTSDNCAIMPRAFGWRILDISCTDEYAFICEKP